MKTALLLAFGTAFLGLLANEVYAWLPWCAKRLISRSTRFLPPEHRERYEEEWLAELEALPTSGLTSVVFACRIFAKAPSTGRAMRHAYHAFRLKRALDLAVCVTALMATAPLFAATGVAVAGSGPVLFRSERVGRGGRRFMMLKFRTMTRPTDGLAGYRITRFGRFLRRFSLDEMPKLLNIVRGEMALIGPPPLGPDAGDYPEALANLFPEAKPGMVSWTALAATGSMSMEEAHRRDIEHLNRWTLRGDLHPLLACAWVPFSRRASLYRADDLRESGARRDRPRPRKPEG